MPRLRTSAELLRGQKRELLIIKNPPERVDFLCMNRVPRFCFPITNCMPRIVGGDVPDAPKNAELLPYGTIADKYINQLGEFYDHITVDKYVIMPNHIHIMLFVLENGVLRTSECGASRTSPPTTTTAKQHSAVSQFVSTFKRFCNKEYGGNIWQRHFNDHIIRNREDYEKHIKYICENPLRWYYDELYAEE